MVTTTVGRGALEKGGDGGGVAAGRRRGGNRGGEREEDGSRCSAHTPVESREDARAARPWRPPEAHATAVARAGARC